MKSLTPPAPGVHRLHPDIGHHNLPIKIAVAGAGGNGSQMITKIARIAYIMRQLGMSRIDLDLYDDDRVSPFNVGRGLFLEREAGQYKSIALIHRANTTFGLQWQAIPERYIDQKCRSAQTISHQVESAYDFLITCVDSGAARKRIYDAVHKSSFAPHYWLDLANEKDFGQVLLGEVGRMRESASGQPRLLTIVEKYPAHYDGTIPETDTPSCSHEEALLKQSPFINDHVACWASDMLWRLLREKQIEYVGAFISLKDGSVNSLKAEAPKPSAAKTTLRVKPSTSSSKDLVTA